VPYAVVSWLPEAVTLVFYLGLIRLARRRLLGELAGAESMKLDVRQSISSAARDAVVALRSPSLWTPP
jgi:hypothetical protein